MAKIIDNSRELSGAETREIVNTALGGTENSNDFGKVISDVKSIVENFAKIKGQTQPPKSQQQTQTPQTQQYPNKAQEMNNEAPKPKTPVLKADDKSINEVSDELKTLIQDLQKNQTEEFDINKLIEEWDSYKPLIKPQLKKIALRIAKIDYE